MTKLVALMLAASTVALAQQTRPGVVGLPTPPRSIASTAAKGAATVRGQIRDVAGRGLPRAQVRLIPPTGSASVVTADLEGRYAFTHVVAGSYRVSAGKPPYLVMEHGQLRPFQRGRQFSVGEDQVLERIDVVLPRGGSVSGRVLDEYGDPVQDVEVRLLQVRYVSGRRQLVLAPGVPGRFTDDGGRYRRYGVPPGRYVVQAWVRGGIQKRDMLAGYVNAFYPATANAIEAMFVTVGLSQDVAGIDLMLIPMKAVSISGVAVDAAGSPLRGAVMLEPSQRSGALAAPPIVATLGADGSFRFRNVPTGEHVLKAIGPRPTPQSESEFSAQYLSVTDHDLTGLTIQTARGSTISGRVRFEGAGSGVSAEAVTISTVPTDPDLVSGTPATFAVRADGTFELNGLTGPRRIEITRAPAPWRLKAILADGQDLADRIVPLGTRQQSVQDLEIVLTDRSASVAGRVTDAGGTAADYSVVVFADDPQRWYDGSRFVRFARANVDGSFEVSGLPAGSYRIAALDRIQGDAASGEWQDPDFLEIISPRATVITLAEGQRMPMPLRLVVR